MADNPILDTFSVTALSGATLEITLSTPGDGRLLTRAVVQSGTARAEGWIEGAYAVPKTGGTFYDPLRARGASHYTIIDQAMVALDSASAEVISTRMKTGCEWAEQVRRDRNAARSAAIRATADVRRVLCHSPAWPDAYRLGHAYAAPAEPGYADWVRFGLPDCEDIEVHKECPSLSTIRARSETWGSYAGHSNTLYLVSVADWDILVQETVELARQEAERQATSKAAAAARLADLRATTVPADALACFKRYGGDSEAAWDDENETAAFLIRTWRDAIEAQGLAVAHVRVDLPIHPPGA